MAHCESCDAKVEKLMNYCPECSEELEWTSATDYYCECGAPASKKFNFCYACGEDLSPDEWKDEVEIARGFKLEHPCDNPGCGGLLQEYMSFCPSCGEEQEWADYYGEEKDDYCDSCGANVSKVWDYCCFCGDENNWVNNNIFKRITEIIIDFGSQILGNFNGSAVVLPMKRSVQFDDYSCGIQCAYSILNYYELADSSNEIRNYHWYVAQEGMDIPDMKKLFKEFDCRLIARNVYNVETITRYIDEGYPVLITVYDEQHWVVVSGYREADGVITHLYIMNPSLKPGHDMLNRWTIDKFLERWDEGWIGIVEDES